MAQRLEHLLPADTEIVLVSGENHLVFTPILPEVVERIISTLHVVVAGRQLTRWMPWPEVCISRIHRESSEAHYLMKSGAVASIKYSHFVLACGSRLLCDWTHNLCRWNGG